MNLNKKSVSGKKTVQTSYFDAKGFRKTMFWNPPTINFFHGWSADIVIGMDLLLNQKIQKRHFFQDFQNSF